jgi:hypothetical protein
MVLDHQDLARRLLAPHSHEFLLAVGKGGAQAACGWGRA